jgi:hypothetical protein
MAHDRAAALAGITRDSIYVWHYDPGGVFPLRRPRGRRPDQAALISPVSGRWPALGGGKGAVASGCGPGAPDHRRTKERRRRRRCYAANASVAPPNWPVPRLDIYF